MSKCKACGAGIIFIRTKAGKFMPCNPHGVPFWKNDDGKETVITKDGETVRCDFKGDPNNVTDIGYLPHWVSCPAADKFRNKQGGKT